MKQCVQKIENHDVSVKAKFPNSKIGVSGLTLRQDIQTSTKIQEVNKELKQICVNHEVSFIDNSSIDTTTLNASKLHLNAKGSALLAVHFIKSLKGDRKPITRRKQPREYFQMSAMHHAARQPSEDDIEQEHSEKNNFLDSSRFDPASGTHDHSLHVIATFKGFKIASLNVNSLLKLLDEIRALVAKPSPDILAIEESKIDDLIPDSEIHIAGYNV